MSRYNMYEDTDNTPKKKPCRTCTDFKSWANKSTKSTDEKQHNHTTNAASCPLDVDELGRSSWNLLHTMAAYFPEKPTPSERKDATQFIASFSRLYPCSSCAEDLRENLKTNQPITTSRYEFSQWMCRLHNTVNVKLGKPRFDCTLVMQRWMDGWKDGSCD